MITIYIPILYAQHIPMMRVSLLFLQRQYRKGCWDWTCLSIVATCQEASPKIMLEAVRVED